MDEGERAGWNHPDGQSFIHSVSQSVGRSVSRMRPEAQTKLSWDEGLRCLQAGLSVCTWYGITLHLDTWCSRVEKGTKKARTSQRVCGRMLGGLIGQEGFKLLFTYVAVHTMSVCMYASFGLAVGVGRDESQAQAQRPG
ncbi:hypothetical protein LX32DRAFT_350497 [Colletotrichum zoysiae]|uniref:Uncharacterized protein n=1 Tax=Colletotrichum zoysiae TaxID=1216348 RepID=A0AAD9M0P0_9PEZI|nr:hypothetical protein LX32DRAFT_350497 [Colletotrichum zoysiae]